jgi:deoxyribonuclease-4
MHLLGAHVSIAGGVDKAPERGRRATCHAIQVFTKSNVQWAARAIGTDEQARFLANLARHEIHVAFAHACYLINLCSADGAIRRRSQQALATELSRCSFLRLPCLVLHPGSHGGQGQHEAMKWIVEGALWAADKADYGATGMRPTLLLETTAGQGNSVGWRFEQLAALLAALEKTLPVGVCFDTCHVFAAGYDLRTAETYGRTMEELHRAIGIHRIEAFHLNDSRGGLGSRLDRHEHIGRGRVGLEGFRTLLNDPRFARCPMVIETPKGKNNRLDIANLRRLRSLIATDGI